MIRAAHRLARVLACLAASAGPAYSQQYPFLPVPGSPKSVRHLFQDSRGRLWLSGEQLACFDGARFFFLRDYGFPEVPTDDVAGDSTGAIWVGAETGVYRFSQGRIQKVVDGVAVSVVPARPGLVLAATGPPGHGIPSNASLVRIQGNGDVWRAEAVASLEAPGPFSIDPSGIILYGVPSRGWNEIRVDDVVNWRPGATLPMTRHLVPNTPGNGVITVRRDHKGCLWFGSVHGAACNCGDGAHPAPYPDADVSYLIHESADGTMVLTGNNLIGAGRPGSFQVATRANGLPGLQDAIQAKDGTIWLGATTGLYRFASPFRIEYWTIREGLPDPPWSVARAGDRIFAGLDRKIMVLGKDRMRWETFASFAEGGTVTALLARSNGDLLGSFISGGAVQVNPDGRVVARTAPGHPKCCSMRLAEADGSEVWLGGTGLGRLFRAGSLLQLEDHALQTQPSGNMLSIKYEPATRTLYTCYNGGLVIRNERGEWREITAHDGLATNGCWSLAPLPNGDIWYAYYGKSAFARIRLDPAGRVNVREFETVNDTFDIDRRGWLWRGAEQAFYVANPAEAEAGQWQQFDQSDGFPANDINSGSVFEDTDGSMWGVPIMTWRTIVRPPTWSDPDLPRTSLSRLSRRKVSRRAWRTSCRISRTDRKWSPISGRSSSSAAMGCGCATVCSPNRRHGARRRPSTCRSARFRPAPTRSRCRRACSPVLGRRP
jgi:hypothetical protein